MRRIQNKSGKEEGCRKARLGERETDTEKSGKGEGCRKARLGECETDTEQEQEEGSVPESEAW